MQPRQRKNQILDAAEHLFTTKGFQATTIEDILAATGIAKGTLYYHFSGKEEILTAIIDRTIEAVAARAQHIADGDADPLTKFVAILAGAQAPSTNAELTEQLHVAGNAEFHLQSNVAMVRGLTPCLVQVVIEGVSTGTFNTPQPLEDVEILLIAGGMLTDEGIFVGETSQRQRRLLGVIQAAERLLGCEPGALLTRLGGML